MQRRFLPREFIPVVYCNSLGSSSLGVLEEVKIDIGCNICLEEGSATFTQLASTTEDHITRCSSSSRDSPPKSGSIFRILRRTAEGRTFLFITHVPGLPE